MEKVSFATSTQKGSKRRGDGTVAWPSKGRDGMRCSEAFENEARDEWRDEKPVLG